MAKSMKKIKKTDVSYSIKATVIGKTDKGVLLEDKDGNKAQFTLDIFDNFMEQEVSINIKSTDKTEESLFKTCCKCGCTSKEDCICSEDCECEICK